VPGVHCDPFHVSTEPVAGADELTSRDCSCVALPELGELIEKKGID
jgi:hypothetical protein